MTPRCSGHSRGPFMHLQGLPAGQTRMWHNSPRWDAAQHLRPQQVPAQVVEQLGGVQAGVEALVRVQLAAGVVRQLPQRRRVHEAAAQDRDVYAHLHSSRDRQSAVAPDCARQCGSFCSVCITRSLTVTRRPTLPPSPQGIAMCIVQGHSINIILHTPKVRATRQMADTAHAVQHGQQPLLCRSAVPTWWSAASVASFV